MTIKNPIKFIKKANKSFNLYLMNYKKINKFIEEWYSKKEGFDKAISNYNDNYKKTKEYFFNGEEDSFKKMPMNTNLFFQMCHINNIELLSYSFSENKIYLKTENGIILATNNRFWTIGEIFSRNGYSVPQLFEFKDFVVFDIGMNRGYAALKFASFDSCKAVYGFEIDENTYKIALENFRLNDNLSNKITAYNFGLFDEEKELDLYYIPGYDGITTANLEFTKIQSEWVKEWKQMKIKKAKVKKASEVILKIIEDENITSNIVLKIDTEGSELKIIDDLISNGLLDKIDLIMGEIHEDEEIDSKLSGFKKIYKIDHTETIYSFCFVKEQFYHVFPKAKSS